MSQQNRQKTQHQPYVDDMYAESSSFGQATQAHRRKQNKKKEMSPSFLLMVILVIGGAVAGAWGYAELEPNPTRDCVPYSEDGIYAASDWAVQLETDMRVSWVCTREDAAVGLIKLVVDGRPGARYLWLPIEGLQGYPPPQVQSDDKTAKRK